MAQNKTPPAEEPLSGRVADPVLGPAGDSEEAENSDHFLIAALGASAGGLRAFENFFRHMPANSGIAFAVIQHLAPDHASALPELLGRCTPMAVEQARDRTRVVPNRVYIIPPNATLTIKKGTLCVASPAEPRGRRMPIDSLFSSLAEDRGENAVCILFSGTGTDGTLGLRAIKDYGGMAMAQTLESAQYDAILRSAIATGFVDHVLPVEEMPAKLVEYAAHLNSTNGKPDGFHDQVAAHIGKIHDLLRRRAGHDFSRYKESTISRRLQRRMRALQIETVEQYVHVLESQPDEADRLFKDLLIGVTQFFRDPDAFEALSRDVIPKLFEGKPDAGARVRACVVGCATGEEAYSIAILLCEHAATLDNSPKIQVFATDIDDRGLEMARKGRYPESIAEHVSPERLERFFTKQQNAYQVKRELRELCIFSNHSFIKDPPFSRLDLISCRNVMIYLGLDLQQKIIPLFHYALRSGGYLFLGPAESASSHGDLFRTVDKKHRIFQSKQTVRGHVIVFPLADTSRPKQSDGAPPEAEEKRLKQLERIILQRYRPACVTVQENGDAVYFSGRIGSYLEPATGSPDSNVINMAREGLRVPLRAALHKAVTSHERVVQKQIAVQTNGGVSHIDLTVEPIAEFQAASLYMIVFDEVAPLAVSTTPHQALEADSEETIRHLEAELRSAQEHAQAVFEELESSNEELKSANEEYQSTNEELETSKEEVQSFNEELETVNSELTRRVAELDHANSDLQNLNASTQIATIFLDTELRIKSFTPAAGAVFRLISGDVGRPITDLAAQFANADFADDIKEVLRTLAPKERDLPGTHNHHYLVRVLPYRTVYNVIDGVVITFTDVTQLKQVERLAEAAKQTAQDAKTYAENVVATVREPLLVLDSDLRVKSASQSFYDVFRVPATETTGRLLYELGDRQWDIPELRRLLTEILPQKRNFEDFRVDQQFPAIGNRVMLLNAREIAQQNGAARLILLAIEDVTERRRAQEEIRRTAEFDEALLTNMGEGLYTLDALGLVTRMNPAAEKLLGWSFEELRGLKMHDLTHHHHPDGTIFPAEECSGLRVLRHGKTLIDHPDVFIRKDGTFFDVICSSAPLRTGKDIVGLVVVFRDVSERKRAEEATVALKNRLAEDLAAMQRLHEISIRLVAHADLQVLLEEILHAAVEITGADLGNIQLLNRDTRLVRIVAQCGFDGKFLGFFDSVHDGVAACGTAMARNQRVIVEDVANDPIFQGTPAREVMMSAGALAVQSTPLVSRSGETLGMLSTHYRSPRRPVERDLQRLDLLARQASDLIERKLVEEALRESKEALAGELSATQRLQAVSAMLIEGGTTETLYNKILDAAVAIMHSDMASMQSLDEDQAALRLLAWRGFDASFGKTFELVHVDAGTACGGAMRLGHRVIVPDVEKCDFIVGEALENHRKMNIGAVQSTPLFSRGGRLLGMISTHWRNPQTPMESDLRLFDILARQAADLIERKQVEDVRGRLAAIVDSSADAIVSKDLNGTILTWNSGAERLFGYTADEAIGRPILMLIPPDHVDEEPIILDQIRRGQRIEHHDTIRRRKDGTLVDVSLTVSPILDENGRVIGASKIARDITDSKRIDQERRDMAVTTALRNAEAELARVARALTVGEMATSIAHEVNQPLAAVVSNAEAGLRWLGGQVPNLPEAQESLALVVRDANRASEVIRRIRQFLKKDSQQIGPLDINEVVLEALDLGHDQLVKSQVTLRTELSDRLPAVRGDRVQLQQVMLNLIMNARDAMASVEDRPRELVVISQKSGTNGIHVAVRDCGSGATPEDMNRLFNAFFTTKPAGIGMGLSISRSIIEAHGGRIWADLNDGPGLTVQFSLPVESENQP